MKRCTKCLVEYPLEHFSKKGSGRNTRCAKCVAEYFKNHYHGNAERKAKHIARVKAAKERRPFYDQARRYGISEAEVERLLSGNNGLCGICNEAPVSCIDHDHASGVVRGALCANCNLGLGNFKDRQDVLERAIIYLGSVSPLSDKELKG